MGSRDTPKLTRLETNPMQHYNDIIAEVLIDEQTLQSRIRELGAEISADYPDGNLLLICILRGGVPFLVHLSRYIDAPHMVDFMAVSSYGVGKRESSGAVRVAMDLQTDIHDKDVLLVEDIIDSGHTIASVLEMLNLRQPRSLRVCALMDKAERREAVVPIHYRGFIIPNKFVFGFGLDLQAQHAAESWRDRPPLGRILEGEGGLRRVFQGQQQTFNQVDKEDRPEELCDGRHAIRP